MSYSIRTIRDILQAAVVQLPEPEAVIEHLLLDSRQIIFPETALFFALGGKRHDGHRFIAGAYAEGVRSFVVEKDIPASRFPEANFLKVADTLSALQTVAKFHRHQFHPIVIGITGSNGKTIVKEWLYQLLQARFTIVRSPRSFNSQVGVPLSVWQLRPEHQVAIFEAGISQTGEMERLAPIIDCRIGVFTNLGEAHSEGFPSQEAKLKEKLRLFKDAEWIIYRRDDPKVDEAIRGLGKKTFTWATNQEADLRILSWRHLGRHTLIEAQLNGEQLQISIPFSDLASIENAVHCWAILLHLQLSREWIAEAMELLEPVAMRLELKEGLNHCLVIDDAYNSDFTSLNLALHFLEQHAQGLKRTLILSDILQSGETPQHLYARVGQLLRDKPVDRFVGVGPEVRRLSEALPPATLQEYYPDTEALLAALPDLLFQHEAILIKGARRFALERVAAQLSRKVHQTTLEINLNALANNLRVYHKLLQPGVRMMVMVKAAAYGSGSREIGRLMEYHGVDYLCVAYGDEGVELRQAGIQLPILVLNPEPATFDQLIRYRLEPKVYSCHQLQAFNDYLHFRNVRVPLHLSIDSGMHRLGFDGHEIPPLLNYLRQHPGLEVRSIFSHLAASEDPEHDAFTHEQFRRFSEAYEQIVAVLGYRPLRHLLNSNGISRFSQYQQDMVRLGIGLYGIDASQKVQDKLQVVLTMKATISQIKDIKPGETVGYGRRAKVTVPIRSATISAGYADGLPRQAGNGRYSVLVRGVRAPILGSVCMDMCMIDVTHIPDANEGDPVIIFGEAPPVEELAAAAGTIPYEIFTGISTRVKRVYVQE